MGGDARTPKLMKLIRSPVHTQSALGVRAGIAVRWLLCYHCRRLGGAIWGIPVENGVSDGPEMVLNTAGNLTIQNTVTCNGGMRPRGN